MLALCIYSLFVFCAIILRVVVQYRLTGDSGIRSVGSSAPPVAKLSTVLLIVSFLGSLVLTISYALGYLLLQLQLPSLLTICAVVLSIVGIIITTVSQLNMGKQWRIGVDETEKTELVTQGIYAYSRNPIYTGVMLFGVGLLLLVPNIFMLVFMLLGYISIELHVRYVEEPYLQSLHGETFTAYKKRVGRYLPKLLAAEA